MILDSKVPQGDLKDKWDNHRFNVKLVNPANKRKLSVIVVGTGLAGASAAASFAEMGDRNHCFFFNNLFFTGCKYKFQDYFDVITLGDIHIFCDHL